MKPHLVVFALVSFNLVTVGLSTPVLTHNVEVAGDVAATMHMEPNHNPRSGEPALTWFALTRKGGALIPFEQCDCALKVYAAPYKEGDAAVLQPGLSPVNAEQYKGIPGAQVVFPKAGQYILELSGTAKGKADFQPFELQYPVTVLTGTAASTAPTLPTPPAVPQPTATPVVSQPAEADNPAVRTVVFLALPIALVVGLIGWQVRRRIKR